MTTRGPFGRSTDGRAPVCTCHGCCGRDFDDFPDEIYVRILWSGNPGTIDLKTTMFRVTGVDTLCSCGSGKQGAIVYQSNKIQFIDGGWPNTTDETCCVDFNLVGTCSEDGIGGSYNIVPGGCFWSFSANWSGGDNETQSIDVTPDSDNPSAYQLNVVTSIDELPGWWNYNAVWNLPYVEGATIDDTNRQEIFWNVRAPTVVTITATVSE